MWRVISLRIIPGKQYRMRCGLNTSDLDKSGTDYILEGAFIPHGHEGFEIEYCNWHVTGIYCGGTTQPVTPGIAHEYDIIGEVES